MQLSDQRGEQLFSDALLERVWQFYLKSRPTPPVAAAMAEAAPTHALQAAVAQPAQAMSLAPVPAAVSLSPLASPALAARPLTLPAAPAASSRWSTGAIVSSTAVVSLVTAAVLLYHFRHHPRIQPILQPLLRALHLSSLSDSSSSSPSSPSPSTSHAVAPPAAAPSVPVRPIDDESSSSLITVDEQQLIRLFNLSLQTLQATGKLDGELEQALYRHLQSTAYPSPASSPSSSHAALQFVAVQWLLLHCTLQLNGALSAEQYDQLQAAMLHTHMPLCWALLSTIPATAAHAGAATPVSDESAPSISQSALNLLRLDVAQRLHDPERLMAVFDTVWSEKARGQPWTVEEAVVCCTAAPHIGRWDEMLQLAELIQQAGAGGEEDAMRLFHQSALHRRDIVDYQVVRELARDELSRRKRVREQPTKSKHADDEHKEPHTLPAAVTAATSSHSLFPELPEPSIAPPTSLSACRWSEHVVLSCHTLYTSVRCSHPHLQQQAERIHPPATSYTPCPLLPSPVVRLTRLGCVVSLCSPLSPQLPCYGLVGEDGWMRLAGWREAEEGAGGTVQWREEWRLAETEGGQGRWEGERMVERVRRKYGSAVDEGEEQQVRVRWMWKVRLHLQMEPSITERNRRVS